MVLWLLDFTLYYKEIAVIFIRPQRGIWNVNMKKSSVEIFSGDLSINRNSVLTEAAY